MRRNLAGGLEPKPYAGHERLSQVPTGSLAVTWQPRLAGQASVEYWSQNCFAGMPEHEDHTQGKDFSG